MEADTEFSRRVAVHAMHRTAGVYKRQIEGIGGQAAITVFTLASQASQHGWVAMLHQASTYYTVIGANLLWVAILFAWHLWLAPYELVFKLVKDQNRPPLSQFVKMPAIPDANLVQIAGRVRLVAEKSPGFRDPVYEINLRDIRDSAHSVWIDVEINQMRRDFIFALQKARQDIADVSAHAAVQKAAEKLALKLMEVAKG